MNKDINILFSVSMCVTLSFEEICTDSKSQPLALLAYLQSPALRLNELTWLLWRIKRLNRSAGHQFESERRRIAGAVAKAKGSTLKIWHRIWLQIGNYASKSGLETANQKIASNSVK